MTEFHKKTYRVSTKQGNDELYVVKQGDSDWSSVQMITNGNENGAVQLRSKEAAEHLHFMLGQMLGL